MTAWTACTLLLALASAARAEPVKVPTFRLNPSANISVAGQKKVPDEAQQLATRAHAALGRGELAAAKRDYLRVLQLVPENVATIINLGLVEFRQKDIPEARKLLKAAVRLDPDAGLAWLILGVIEYDRNKLDAALAALAQAVWLEPRNATAHHYLGVTIGRKGWFLGAEDELRKAIELEPGYAEAHFNLAVFYLERRPPAVELARRHYQKSLDLGAAPDATIEKSLADPSE